MSMIFRYALILVFAFQHLHAQSDTQNNQQPNQHLAQLVDEYYEQELKLNPVNATFNGDNRFNDKHYNDLTDSFRSASRGLYQTVLSSLQKNNRNQLSKQDGITYEILKQELEMKLGELQLGDSLLVFNQMNGTPQAMALLGSGAFVQPFKTVQDYDNWLKRASVFPAWTDSAIAYFRKGIQVNMVHPQAVVKKMIPQVQKLISHDPQKSTFYGPIINLPNTISNADKQRLTAAYSKFIMEQVNPSYQKLFDFLKNEYLPKGRTSSGYVNLPGGKKLYAYYLRKFTTTNKTADEIFDIGIKEVARIESEMNKVKEEMKYKGDLKSFFKYLRTDPKFFPYKTPEEVLNAYRAVQHKIAPHLKKMFNQTPKTPFEIRQVEEFRAASSAIHYFDGSYEENRPGIFYVPIIDATKTNISESTFAHEAIPGHHYQVMLQAENTSLPKFRRFGNSTVYNEGWALYVESLGKDLGLYSDPYQYMMALSDGILRAVRLVVDPGLHAKGWSREQAIKYMTDHTPFTEQVVEAEIERYMAYPGQAVSYKIGEQKIKELRAKYNTQLGGEFNIAEFHDEILQDGSMPLDILERKMDDWAAGKK
jgi:uncharacterized protein (DUF885 family)